MKINIHPTWYNDTKVTCACGNSFTTGSTQPVIRLEICSKCHPLYTGQQKLVDTLGQVDKFQKKSQESVTKKQIKIQILEARAAKIKKQSTDKPSLKDLLMQARKGLTS